MQQPSETGNQRSETDANANDGGQATSSISPDYAENTVRALAVGLRLQTLVGLVLAGALLLVGPVAAYSSLCGSLAVYLPGLVFTFMVARKLGSDTSQFLRAAAIAEVGKLFGVGLLCALVFVWVRPLAPGWFFVGMLTVLVTSWVGLARAIR